MSVQGSRPATQWPRRQRSRPLQKTPSLQSRFVLHGGLGESVGESVTETPGASVKGSECVGGDGDDVQENTENKAQSESAKSVG